MLEAGENVGHAVREWGHVQLFSPWEYNIDRAAERLLSPTGWNSPDPKQYPTGAELVERYLEPLAGKTALAPHIRTRSRVTGISRTGFDKLKSKGREKAPSEPNMFQSPTRSPSACGCTGTATKASLAAVKPATTPAGDTTHWPPSLLP